MRQLSTSFGLLLLRLGLGGLLLLHGWGKLQMVLAGDYDKFADPIGLGKQISLILVMAAEFGCAILVIIGLFTRLAAIPIVIAMGVAAFVMHADAPLSMEGAAASKEPALLFMVPFLALVFTGAGIFSIDGLIWYRKQPPPA